MRDKLRILDYNGRYISASTNSAGLRINCDKLLIIIYKK